MKNNKKYMTDQEFDDFVNNSRKDGYGYKIEELEHTIDTGIDCRNDYRHYDQAMAFQCDVVLWVFLGILEERNKAMQRKNKIEAVLNDDPEDEWWVL